MFTSFRVCVSKHTLTVSRFNTVSVISSSVVSFAFKSQIENNFGTASGWTCSWSFWRGWLDQSWICILSVHFTLQLVDFCVILQLSQTAIFPLMVTFLEHEEQELYLVTLLIPRISANVSVVVEISVTSGSFSLNGSASFMVYKLSCFGVFKYLWFWDTFILRLLKK